ncbi:MAG: hypothetical protein WC119_00545 [Synergistaceae bacterium]
MTDTIEKVDNSYDEIIPCYILVAVMPVKMGSGKKNPKPLSSTMITLGGIRPSEAHHILNDFFKGDE